MAKQPLDRQIRKSLKDARTIVENIIKTDANEADTGMRIERILENLMGYDVFRHLTHEYAVHGISDTIYCDYAIQIDEEKKVPTILIEIKRASMELSPKHLKQTASYAINIGCEWCLLTNGRNWQLYHISFGQPPQVILLDSWDLLTDNISLLADKFALVGYKNVKRDGLKQLWEKSNVLTPANVIKILLSEESINMVRRILKKTTNITVTPEEIVGTIRRLFNESALAEMDNIKICLPSKKVRLKDKTAQSPVVEDIETILVHIGSQQENSNLEIPPTA